MLSVKMTKASASICHWDNDASRHPHTCQMKADMLPAFNLKPEVASGKCSLQMLLDQFSIAPAATASLTKVTAQTLTEHLQTRFI